MRAVSSLRVSVRLPQPTFRVDQKSDGPLGSVGFALAMVQLISYLAIVGFTQPPCSTFCDGRKLK
jgi:hypothetical protein